MLAREEEKRLEAEIIEAEKNDDWIQELTLTSFLSISVMRKTS
jgi:hypothetical protein